jgi:hypothetical protein
VAKLQDLAAHVRSKNAGPFWVTLDIFCDDECAYARLARAAALAPPAIAGLYGVPDAAVRIFPDPVLKTIKISFPRPVTAGAFRDRDAHAGQMFVPLLAVDID